MLLSGGSTGRRAVCHEKRARDAQRSVRTRGGTDRGDVQIKRYCERNTYPRVNCKDTLFARRDAMLGFLRRRRSVVSNISLRDAARNSVQSLDRRTSSLDILASGSASLVDTDACEPPSILALPISRSTEPNRDPAVVDCDSAIENSERSFCRRGLGRSGRSECRNDRNLAGDALSSERKVRCPLTGVEDCVRRRPLEGEARGGLSWLGNWTSSRGVRGCSGGDVSSCCAERD